MFSISGANAAQSLAVKFLALTAHSAHFIVTLIAAIPAKSPRYNSAHRANRHLLIVPALVGGLVITTPCRPAEGKRVWAEVGRKVANAGLHERSFFADFLSFSSAL